MATWAGYTVPELYHKSKIEMNERGTKLRFGGKKLWRGDFAEGDEVGFNRHTLGDFHVKKGLKGLEFAGVGDGEAQEEFLNGFFTASVFDSALGAERGGAGDDHDGARGVESGNEGEQSVIFGEERIGRGREIEFLFARLRVDVENGEVAFAGTFGYALEDEFAGSRNFQQVEIFGGRTYENQVGILGVIEGEETAAFHAKIAAQKAEDLIEAVDGDDFADAGVMIPDDVFRIAGGIEITHAGFGAADESGVAKDQPGFFGAGEKRFPESLEGGGSWFDFAGKCGGCGFASEKEREERAGQEKRKNHHREQPGAGNLFVDRM
jgi:hypothetical protein